MTTATAERQAVTQRTGLATIDEAGEFLGLKRSSIYKMLDNESLKRVHLPGISAVRISWASIHAVADGAQ